MKQTSLLPTLKHTSLKKSPLPLLSKLDSKSPISKVPFQELLSSLSPMVKNAPVIEEEDDIRVTPVKPSNNSKRRTRDVFDGIPQSFEKRLKHTESTAESESQKVHIKIPFKQTMPTNEGQQKADKGEKSVQPVDASKEQGNNKNIALNTLSPTSPLFKEMNGLPDQVGSSQMKKLLSDSKKAKLNFEAEENKETKEIQNQTPQQIETEPAQNKDAGQVVSEKPKISASTLSIISSLKAKKEQNKTASTESKIAENLNMKTMEQESESVIKSIKITPAENQTPVVEPFKTPSIREKYEDLLRPDRDFTLPFSYKRLLTVFETLDRSINYFGARREATFFGTLRDSLKDTLKIEISPAQLAQILYIFPNAYIVSWERNEKNKGEYDLYLKFNADENETEATKKTSLTQKLELRSSNFKKGLLELTKKHHTEFLKKLSPEEAAKNYDQERCWNSKFKVHECPSIPEAKLPSRPHKESLMSVQDFLLSSEVKDKRVKQIMEECLKKQEEKPAAVIPVSTTQKNVMGISEKLLAKIRAKEQALAINAQEEKKNQVEQLSSLMKQELKKIAETLRIYYMQRKVASMFFVNVVEHLSKNCNGLVLGKSEASKYIDELVVLCPEWLSVTEINNNRLLKMEKSVNMQVIYDRLEKKVT